LINYLQKGTLTVPLILSILGYISENLLILY